MLMCLTTGLPLDEAASHTSVKKKQQQKVQINQSKTKYIYTSDCHSVSHAKHMAKQVS